MNNVIKYVRNKSSPQEESSGASQQYSQLEDSISVSNQVNYSSLDKSDNNNINSNNNDGNSITSSESKFLFFMLRFNRAY